MDVPGRKELEASDNDESIVQCQPYQGDSDAVQSEMCCKFCNEFICASCIKAHRKFVGTKNHKDKLSKSLDQTDDFTEFCDVHENEIVKFYCKDHDSVRCGDCIVLNHASCKVQLVSNVSSNYGDCDELLEIKHRIDNLRKNLASCMEEIKRSLKTAEEIKTDAIREIKQFRQEIDNYLNKMEADILQKVDEVNAKDVCSQEKLQDQCKTLTAEIEEFQNKLELCKDNSLFVTSKRALERLQKFHDMNEEISAKSQINAFKFKSSEYINALQIRNRCLGNLSTQIQRFSGPCKRTLIGSKAQFVQKFNMQGKKETDCFITGMTIISETEIMCADKSSLKVLDHRKGKVTSVLKLSSLPADVTTINSSYAATTLPNEGKLLFVITQSGLTKSHSLDVRKGCMGIDHRNGMMAVSFTKPSAVQVINMDGQIIHAVKETSVLKSPLYVSISNDNKNMFVSDIGNEAVHEFTIKGVLKDTTKSEEMGSPLGSTVTNCGCAVVCYPGKGDKVGLIVSGTRKILPFYLQNVLKPASILISEEQNKMFISEHLKSADCNFIKIFDLK